MIRRVFTVATIALFASAYCQAAVYKWVDEDGHVVYSQTAPPNTENEVIKPPAPPPKGSQNATGSLQDYQQAQDDKIEDDAIKQQKANEDKLQMDARKKVCEAARHNLKVLNGRPNKMILKEGQVVKLSAEEREAGKTKAQKDIAEFCDNKKPAREN